MFFKLNIVNNAIRDVLEGHFLLLAIISDGGQQLQLVQRCDVFVVSLESTIKQMHDATHLEEYVCEFLLLSSHIYWLS